MLVAVLSVVSAADNEPKETMKTAETLHIGLGGLSVGVGGLGIGIHAGITWFRKKILIKFGGGEDTFGFCCYHNY